MDYSTLQNDVLTFLQSWAYLDKVLIYAVKDADPTSQVNKALASLGASIAVSKPFLIGINPEANPPTGLLEMRFETKVKPIINNSAAGSGLTCEQIDFGILQALLGWGPEGSVAGTFFAPANASSPAVYPDKAFEGRLLRMQCMFSGDDFAQTNAPDLAEDPPLTITITVPAPDAAAPVLYTTDGSCPGFIQGTTNPAGTSALYTEPFTTVSGTVIRALAVAPGKIPSIVNYSSIFDQVATPTIAFTPGDLTDEVTLACATVGAGIYFTTDGSAPVPGVSPTQHYTTRFSVDAGGIITITALAIKTGWTNSAAAQSLAP